MTAHVYRDPNHGYLVNTNIWRKLVPLLAEHFRCITPDWPLGSHVVPMRRDADLTPPGIAALIAQFLDALDVREVTLFGNDSGGAYSQLVAAGHPARVARLVLNSCETPECTWPPGGFSLLKAMAVHPATYRALYQVLRIPRTWRWRNTYGWLAKDPIEARVMDSYVRPVLADQLAVHFTKPVLRAWAAADRVFPLVHAQRYAARLNAPLETIPDSYTYTAEDQPARTAVVLRDWMHTVASGSAPTRSG